MSRISGWRGVSRPRELAVRAAIGASRVRIARQLLIEGLLLALAGGAVGVLLAMLVLGRLRASLPEILLTTQPYIEDIIRAVRAEIQAIDPAQPVYRVTTLEALMDDSMLNRSTSAAMTTLFSALAVVLAAVGIYGVVAYGVSQQRREFAVRLVLREGMLMAGAGMVSGVAGALSLSGLMANALYGVSPVDPLTYSSAVGVIAVTSLIACGVPAWRASTTQPAGALRSD